jgi:hypothetical protein
MRKIWLFVLLIILLSIPTFSQMLRVGIFSMQDFHFFRLVEFDKCIRDLQIPCRWASDSGAGFGEPLFNFYGQLVYTFGELIHGLTFSLIDSLKITFIFSLVASAISIFFLSRKIWKSNWAGILSAVIYLYAPYRAVDVWVRGALPEAFSFVFFPLIILQLENYLESRKKRHLLMFSLFFAFLILNHNLSVILFAPFLIVWIIFRFLQTKEIKPFLWLGVAGIFSLVISAFYILPVIFESKFIDINSTTLTYYDWRANFVTIYQLFISRFWGYGGSTWGSGDGLSLSLGQLQYLTPMITGVIILSRKKLTRENMTFFVLVLIGIFALFLTHNKSTFIWNTLSFMKYIQFPWRFLSTSIFALALASGKIVGEIKKRHYVILIGIIVITIAVNFQFFKPDIWYKVNDFDLEHGPKWTEATFSSLSDYWPIYGKLPNKEAFTESNDLKLISKKSNSQTFEIKTFGKEIEFPVAYFPGWEINYNKRIFSAISSKNGLITANLSKSNTNIVTLEFKNTQIRSLANLITIIGVLIFVTLFIIKP